MLGINILGGAAVLGSYALGISSHPNAAEALWGGMTLVIRPLYTAGMLNATLGYFAFTYFLLFRLDPIEARVGRRFGFGLFNLLYAAILFPSALWMPLTFELHAHPSSILWGAIRLDLAIVGLGSLGLLISLLKLQPRQPTWAYGLAIAGSLGFCLQTALLDALIWPVYYWL